MEYLVTNEGIVINSKEEFNPQHILECGQVFSYTKKENYIVFPEDKLAEIIETETGYKILTNNPKYFVNYFDLDCDYKKIKDSLLKNPIMSNAINFGSGIRILKQDLFEMVISFIVSANNNIKRIQLILGRLRNALGKGDGEIKASPSINAMREKDEDFYKSLGAGYRAKYLAKVVHQFNLSDLEEWKKLDTLSLRKRLLSLIGIGPKVADCILLFGYGRGDVFPVDTWIQQMYNKYFSPLENRNKIRDNLVEMFGELAGYAQQYLFYYQRSFKKN